MKLSLVVPHPEAASGVGARNLSRYFHTALLSEARRESGVGARSLSRYFYKARMQAKK